MTNNDPNKILKDLFNFLNKYKVIDKDNYTHLSYGEQICKKNNESEDVGNDLKVNEQNNTIEYDNDFDENEFEKKIVKKRLNEGSKWNTEDEQKIIDMRADKKTIEEIAEALERTKGGIKSRLNQIAYNYLNKEKKSIYEVCELTGYTEEKINLLVKRREKKTKGKNKYLYVNDNDEIEDYSVKKSKGKNLVCDEDLNQKLNFIVQEIINMKKSIEDIKGNINKK